MVDEDNNLLPTSKQTRITKIEKDKNVKRQKRNMKIPV